MNFFIQFDKELTLSIDEVNLSNYEKEFPDLSTLINKENTFYIICNEEDSVYMPSQFITIGNYGNADILLLNDTDMFPEFDGKKNLYLKVNKGIDFSNMIINNAEKLSRVDLILKDDINDYGPEFFIELDKIVDFLKDNNSIIIPLLNGFYLKHEKFDSFGESALFIAKDTIYYHPRFFYNNSGVGELCKIKDYDMIEDNVFFSKPHLLCIACESFYCDRNIYMNKIKTEEMKTPSSLSCARSTVLYEYSSKLFNHIFKDHKIEAKNLDLIPELEKTGRIGLDEIWLRLASKKIISNTIKEMDFSNRIPLLLQHVYTSGNYNKGDRK